MGTVIVTKVGLYTNPELPTPQQPFELFTIILPDIDFSVAALKISSMGGVWHTMGSIKTFIPAGQLILIFDWNFETKREEDLQALISRLSH